MIRYVLSLGASSLLFDAAEYGSLGFPRGMRECGSLGRAGGRKEARCLVQPQMEGRRAAFVWRWLLPAPRCLLPGLGISAHHAGGPFGCVSELSRSWAGAGQGKTRLSQKGHVENMVGGFDSALCRFRFYTNTVALPALHFTYLDRKI